MFVDYVQHGWVLVPLTPGEKGTTKRGWNKRDQCISHPIVAKRLKAAGLAHAYSGTCAMDIDDMQRAQAELDALGIDLPALLNDPAAVFIDSGRENRAKLLYRLNEPLPTLTLIKKAVQLRCATRDGLTVQDALPPSIHPDTERPYEWCYNDSLNGDWRKLPPLPEKLYELWLQHSNAPAAPTNTPATATPDELRMLAAQYDPDCDYEEWLRVGMALHHESDGSAWGLDIWDEWSAQGAAKYKGRSDLESHWRSFGRSATPVTAGSLRSAVTATPDDFPEVPVDDGDTAPPVEDDPWEASKKKFTLVHALDWANRPPPSWLIDKILPQQDLAMVYGPPSSGKSFLALDIALAIAGTEDWRDWQTVHGDVAWVAAEAAGSLRNRIQAYMHGKNVSVKDHRLWIIGETPDLSQASEVNALVEAAQQVSPKLIVVDTLSAASGGANENSGEDMNAILTACRALHNATGALVLLIHHSGKDKTKGARGWSGILAAIHTEIEVVNFEGSKGRMATVTKQRDAQDGVQMPFQLLPVPVSMDDTSCIVEHMASANLAATISYSDPLCVEVSEPHVSALIDKQLEQTTETTDFGDLLS